jgi:hypothetical protein
MNIASVRILRLALGAALAMWFSQAAAWDMSFIAPVFAVVLLSTPLPALPFKSGIKFVLALALAIYSGLFLLPFLVYQLGVGILLLTLVLFWSFYITAKGGSAIVGTFVTIGLSLTVAIGSTSIDGFLQLAAGVSVNALFGIAFVWFAHALLPDSMAQASPQSVVPASPPEVTPVDLATARGHALRSLAIVFPVCLLVLLSSNGAAYAAVMIKVASMGQQTSTQGTAQAARSLLGSTVIGGIGAIIGWQILSLWTSLIMYTLLIGLAGLLIGPRIFKDQGMHPNAATWSYGYVTMIIILAPAVLDGMGGSHAGANFQERLVMFIGATLYGVVAVYIFDAFWPKQSRKAKSEMQPVS